MKYFIASCFQSLKGRYLSLEENVKSKIKIKAENEDEAWIRISELQQEDSEFTVEERWGMYEISEDQYNDSNLRQI